MNYENINFLHCAYMRFFACIGNFSYVLDPNEKIMIFSDL